MYLMYLICSLALVINIPKILKICGYLFERRLHRLKGFFRKTQQTMRTSPEGTALLGIAPSELFQPHDSQQYTTE